ncbi:MAG: SWIM zinc finger family protein [Armatimonadetes bacterium]|nr:SWIM zinc finger family protein [Armatimonadota bacterium]
MMRPTQRETVPEKAERLKKNYRVILTTPGDALVIGDHDTYEVRRPGARWTCTCPWGKYRGHLKDCSHIVAVRRALDDPASQIPVGRLADILIAANELR